MQFAVPASVSEGHRDAHYKAEPLKLEDHSTKQTLTQDVTAVSSRILHHAANKPGKFLHSRWQLGASSVGYSRCDTEGCTKHLPKSQACCVRGGMPGSASPWFGIQSECTLRTLTRAMRLVCAPSTFAHSLSNR